MSDEELALDDDVFAAVLRGVSEGKAKLHADGRRAGKVCLKGETVESLVRVVTRNGWPATQSGALTITGLPIDVDDDLLLGAVRVEAE